jgi:hypothetical protein
LPGGTSRFGDVNGDADEALAIVSGMTLVVLTGRLCTRRAGVNLSGSMTLIERTGKVYELEIERSGKVHIYVVMYLKRTQEAWVGMPDVAEMIASRHTRRQIRHTDGLSPWNMVESH